MTDEALVEVEEKPKKKRRVPVVHGPFHVLQEILKMPVEEQKKTIDGLLPEFKGTLREIVEAAQAEVKAAWARDNDDAEAFCVFYELITGKNIPPMAKRWVESVYEARKEGKGVVIEAFRGSTKTTTMTILFMAWRIGKEPQRSNLLIQSSDDSAADNSEQIADLIANNLKYRSVFPNVAPDMDKGWGAGGYEVKRTDISYEEWRDLNTERKDPTLLGVSYQSRTIIGKHPDGVLVVDDINNEQNTSSAKELEGVMKILTGTIFPTITKDTWVVFIGTPWVENDVLHRVSSTGEFVHVKTPVMERDEDGVEFDGENVRLAWPDMFGVEEIRKQKKLAGTVEFARMFLLDLSALKNRVFKYQLFPNSEVRYTWPLCGGVDFAGVGDEFKNKSGQNDYFAMAYVAKLPGGGAVVIDGVLDRCTQAQAEEYVNRAQAIFPSWQHTVVEGDGMGDSFIQVIKRNPHLKIIPMKTKGRGKALRLGNDLSPWLENGTIRISDAETPFLHELRKELDMWPIIDHEDALDAVYWAAMGMPDVLVMPKIEYNMLPEARYKKKNANPMLAFGSK
jgi:predicted phage terminase large subunit-like protein